MVTTDYLNQTYEERQGRKSLCRICGRTYVPVLYHIYILNNVCDAEQKRHNTKGEYNKNAAGQGERYAEKRDCGY